MSLAYQNLLSVHDKRIKELEAELENEKHGAAALFDRTKKLEDDVKHWREEWQSQHKQLRRFQERGGKNHATAIGILKKMRDGVYRPNSLTEKNKETYRLLIEDINRGIAVLQKDEGKADATNDTRTPDSNGKHSGPDELPDDADRGSQQDN